MFDEIKNTALELLQDKKLNDREIVFRLKRLLFENDFYVDVEDDSKELSKLVEKKLHKLKNPQKFHESLIPTGYNSFDKYFGGFSFGEYVIIGARPSMGKTQFMVNLALNISEHTPTLFISLDLSSDLIANRFMAAKSQIPISDFMINKLSSEQLELVSGYSKELEKHKIFVNNTCADSINTIKHVCKKHVEENNIKIIFIDYLQSISSHKFKRYRERELEISHINRELKKFAKDNNVCIVVSSQLNRSVETRSGDKRPLLSDLRESGSIEQDADKVVFIHRPEYYGITQDADGNNIQGIIELIVAKNRNGHIGDIMLRKNKEFTNIYDYDNNKNDFEFLSDRLDEIDEPF